MITRPSATDIPTLGFTPICDTPILLHDHDEYVDESTFLRGLSIYMTVIPALACVGAAE